MPNKKISLMSEAILYLEVHRISLAITSSVSINSHTLGNALAQDSEVPTYTLMIRASTKYSRNVVDILQWWNSVTFPQMIVPQEAALTWCLHRRPVNLEDISSERKKTKRLGERNTADTHPQRSGQEGEQTITRSRCLLMDKAASVKGCMSAK